MRSLPITALLVSLAASAAAATGGLPLTLSHSGYLLDAADVPVANEALAVSFAIHDQAAPGGAQVPAWEATCAVAVARGYYAVVLGAAGCAGTSTLETSDVPSGGARWLQISVAGAVLLPRVALTAAPTAATAATALDAARLGGALPATFHDASLLTGTVPAAALGAGSTSLTTLGTIATGTWQGTPVADAYVAGAASWNARLAAVAHDGTLAGDGTGANALRVNVGAVAGAVAAGDDARFGRWTGGATGLDAATGRTSLGLGSAATADAGAFATTAQGTKADNALPAAGGTATGVVNLDAGATVSGVPVNPAGRADDETYFSPQPFFEAGRLPYAMASGTPTFTTVSDASLPFSKVALSPAATEFAAEYVPVQAGETIYGEIWAMRAAGSTGNAGGFYFGVSRFDKDKRPIAGNQGLHYFVASGHTVPQTGTWTKYTATATLPTTHTPFEGSDGGAVRYVRPYVIVNYPSGTIPTYWGGAIIRRATPRRDTGPVTMKGNLDVNGYLHAAQRISVGGAGQGEIRPVFAGGRKTVTVGATVDLLKIGHTATGTLFLSVIGASGQTTATLVAEHNVQVAYGSPSVGQTRKHQIGTRITNTTVAYDNSIYKLTVNVSGLDATADLVWSFQGVAQGDLQQL